MFTFQQKIDILKKVITHFEQPEANLAVDTYGQCLYGSPADPMNRCAIGIFDTKGELTNFQSNIYAVVNAGYKPFFDAMFGQTLTTQDIAFLRSVQEHHDLTAMNGKPKSVAIEKWQKMLKDYEEKVK